MIKKALQMGKLGKAIRLGEETLGGKGIRFGTEEIKHNSKCCLGRKQKDQFKIHA